MMFKLNIVINDLSLLSID